MRARITGAQPSGQLCFRWAITVAWLSPLIPGDPRTLNLLDDSLLAQWGSLILRL